MGDELRTSSGETPPSVPSLQLSYATPRPKSPPDTAEVFLHVGRRCIFAIGVGIFMYGVGNGWMDRGDVGEMMGWGAALAALTMPWGWKRVPWEK